MKPPRTVDEKAIREHLEQVNKVLSNISFGEVTDNKDLSQNIEGWYATATSPGVADTEFAVPHQLGRIPIGFFVLTRTKGGVVYKSLVTPWSTNNIYLKDSSVTDVLLLFIV